ncbi:hypothetical protein HY230_08775 [Candidatus Acetothermia bacterium]|nr:hypothetical protein [Candidatus Acetothermia bacterium]
MTNSRDQLLQKDWQDYIVNKLGNEQWVRVYCFRSNEIEHTTFYCALVPNRKIKHVLEHVSWDSLIGDGMPGCTLSWIKGRKRVSYSRLGDNSGIEPLVFFRKFHGIKSSHMEISEEFRYFHNLYYDNLNKKFIKIDDNGDEEDVILLEENAIMSWTRFLGQRTSIN